jgi:hypothetical protein
VDSPDDSSRSTALTLSVAEREALLKACRHYRATLPVYLKSGAQDAAIIADLIQKLTSGAGEE